MSNLVSYGLGPYFNEMTIREIVEGNSYFTLHIDETVTGKVKKTKQNKTNGFTCMLLVRSG